MSSESIVLDAVVVGAGVSGLSAANELQRCGLSKVAVLEAQDRVGGRTYTVRNPQAGYVDLGGAYVGVTQKHLYRLVREFNLKVYKVDETKNTLYYDFDTKFRRLFKHTESFKIGNFIENLDLNNFLRRLDEIGEQINVQEPWSSPNAVQWDRMSYGEFVDRTCWTVKARRFAKFFININVTCEPYEASLLWFAWYVRQCGGVRRIISTTGGGQECKIEGGTMQISERLAQKLGEKKVHLADPVYRIWYDQSAKAILEQVDESTRSALSSQLSSLNGNFCLVKTLSGKQYVARKVILAMPPTLQSKIHFEPALPAMRNQLMQRQPMGSVIKFIIYYEKRFWTELGLHGAFLMVGNDAERCPMFYTLDDTKPDGTKPAIIGFILADKCRQLLVHSRDKRKQMIARCFASALRDDRALKPIHYEEQNFMSNQYIAGCYTAFCPPGTLTNYGKHLRQSLFNSLFFAGTETATEWSGYINGAIQAGERAAREAAVALGKLQPKDIWIEEPDSDDYPHYEFPVSWYEAYAPSVGKLISISGLLAAAGILTVVHSKRLPVSIPCTFRCPWIRT